MRPASKAMEPTMASFCSSSSRSHRDRRVEENASIDAKGERMSWAAPVTRSPREKPPPRCRAISNRIRALAAARFSDSALPEIGTRTVVSVIPSTSGERP
jgi:hypothetical protein